jgi:hypothetical protein
MDTICVIGTPYAAKYSAPSKATTTGPVVTPAFIIKAQPSSKPAKGAPHNHLAVRHQAQPRSAGNSRAPENIAACTKNPDARGDGRHAAVRPPVRRSAPVRPGFLLPAGTTSFNQHHLNNTKQLNPGVNFSGKDHFCEIDRRGCVGVSSHELSTRSWLVVLSVRTFEAVDGILGACFC